MLRQLQDPLPLSPDDAETAEERGDFLDLRYSGSLLPQGKHRVADAFDPAEFAQADAARFAGRSQRGAECAGTG
ncbi:hypothetical protein GCM10009754_11980 [Amycolatopsis minnesotensis]|uniref:Uncharacterized protein n=1 Tax=Amycolatopsis minnesotensis TaxID=337894 RepID=A0ABP5BI66_9PSEU